MMSVPLVQATDPFLTAGTVIRWLQLLGAVLLLGSVGFRQLVVLPLARKPGLAGLGPSAGPALRRLAWTGAALLVVALPLRLVEASARPEGFVPTLFQTHWGAGWWVYLVVSGLAVTGLVLVRGVEDRARGWSLVAGAALLLPLAPMLGGSAWTVEPRALTAPATYLHVLAAGVWLGGLVALLAAGLPALRHLGKGTPPPVDGPPPLALLVNGFSRVALSAVAVLVVSGIVSNWARLGTPLALFGTAYGRVLLVKLALVGAAFLLGLYNWRKVRPSLVEHPDAGQLRIPATLEMILGILVLLVTALLVAIPLPG
jgi:putative copper export protein